MTELNLSGQSVERAGIAPKLLKLKNLMDQRKPIWNKVSTEKKRLWVKSEKDPIMDIAWDVYKYLRNNFFGESEID